MIEKDRFQAAKKPIKMPQARARCGVLTMKDRILGEGDDQNFGGVSDDV
jgi:hypothetical protein